jgi:chromosome segregation ATPase
VLAMTWMSDTQASPNQARHLADAQHAMASRNLDSDGTAGDGQFEALPPNRGSNDKSVQVAQATTSDTDAPQQSLEQEHHGAETLSCELSIARRDIELVQHLGHEHDRAERQEQDLAAARRDVETQTALTSKAVEETARVKQGAQSGAAELQESLQQERERAELLKHDLAAARRELETQTALVAKAGDVSSRLKQSAESEVAELRRSMQKEHDRTAALAHDLSLARSAIYAYEAQASKASDEVAELREQAPASPAAAMRKSAQDARDRAERLEQDLATARRDLETQTALAAKASEEAARTRETVERDSAALRSLLQQERARAERLERDLALAQGVAPNGVTIGPMEREKPVEEGANSIADRAPAAGARRDAQPNFDEAAMAARLIARASALLRQGAIGAARIVLERAVEMGSAQASFSLAETYDPLILAKWGTYGTRGDTIKAQNLYAKADAAGIQEAKARFEALRR